MAIKGVRHMQIVPEQPTFELFAERDCDELREDWAKAGSPAGGGDKKDIYYEANFSCSYSLSYNTTGLAKPSTGRAKCRQCGEKITKGQTQIGCIWSPEDNSWTGREVWMHAHNCGAGSAS